MNDDVKQHSVLLPDTDVMPDRLGCRVEQCPCSLARHSDTIHSQRTPTIRKYACMHT